MLSREGVGDVLQHDIVVPAEQNVVPHVELVGVPAKSSATGCVLHGVDFNLTGCRKLPQQLRHVIDKGMAVADK
ncbi:hypothetical protein SDC9_89053 [bioreactor metagenome]|uniref:Uncharacterized protein n=1 Tax=bioreactor metagenome TaxID=1076179 RepID=A0A644ZPS5_9ZZZZ